MADSKISALASLASPDSLDIIPIVDVSDTSMSSGGTTKKISVESFNMVTNGGDSTDNALVRWDGTTGKIIQNSPSGTTLGDDGLLTTGSAVIGSGTSLARLSIRGGTSAPPTVMISHDTDTSGGKNGGLFTRTRMSNRYLITGVSLGQNDSSFGNPGIINTTAWEYNNNTYTTLVAPTEFKGWNWQYWTGSVYSQIVFFGVSGVGIRLPTLGSTPTSVLDINGDSLRLRTSKTPSSATAAGNAGDICWDSNYIYICVAANTWKRSAISTW